MALELSLSVCNYDRTAALFDGRAPIEGCDVTAVANSPEESFHRAFKFQEFDVTEISMSSYLVTLSRGDAHYVAIPAFVSRLFRHSGIYVRTDRIKTPADLKGKTIGMPEYQMTANVWVRGMLEEEYGVKPRDIKWRRGGLEEPGREERAKINLPPEIDLQQVPDDRTISDMLAKGEIDGLAERAGAELLSCAARRTSARLFPDYPAVEEAYFKKTKLFPIMHAIGIRRSIVEKYPWVAVNVYKAFLKAKALCMARACRDRPSARDPAVAGACLRPRAQGDGRGLLGLWRAREQAGAGDAGALFVPAGPVGAAGAARRDVRQADL